MTAPLTINLTEEQQSELEQIRNCHELPYMRERATAILKIAEGRSGRQVAQSGLLKPRHKVTLYEWVRRYKDNGVEGLRIRPGRGRKPSFSPPAS